MARIQTPRERRASAAVARAGDGFEAVEAALMVLPDPRRRQGVRYPLRSVVLIALMAMVCGCDDAEAMEDWGEHHEAWLRELLDLPHGVPSQDVFLAVFAALDPKEFSAFFLIWVDFLRSRAAAVSDPHIAIDGKTSRRTFSSDSAAIHTVSAWMSEAGLVVGQTQTSAKSNEITAIPELLRSLTLKGTTVTIDAMGCQTEIAETIVRKDGHYLLAVKNNQPALHRELAASFEEVDGAANRARDLPALPPVGVHEETNKDHGRVEVRRVEVIRKLDRMDATVRERWCKLACIIRVTRERTVLSTGHTSRETAFYIGSHPTADAALLARFIRSHWGIENSLHWVLDIAFHDDQSRHRTKNLAANLTTLRHMANNLLKQEKTCRLGVANKRKRANRSQDYLLTVITGPEVAVD